MKEKDIVRLGVRLLGLVFLYHGLQPLPQAVIQFCVALTHGNVGTMLMSLAVVVWPLLVAYWLLRGAPLLMGIAFSDAKGSHEPARNVQEVPPQYPGFEGGGTSLVEERGKRSSDRDIRVND